MSSWIACALALVALMAASPVHAAKRVALVIGNDAYATLPDLNNARADARGMAAKLKSMGFEVILKLDASRRDFGRAVTDFEGRLASAEVGLVFYAGHGIQANGRNWLIPSNAEIEAEEDLEFEGIDSNRLLESMKRAGSPLNIVILDACRDNPLPKRSRSAARGLAIAHVPTGIKGTAIVYSAAPGQTAEDGDPGGNGVFTGALLAVLDEPGLKLEDVFKRTAARVARRTGGKQKPWINSSVTEDFYFRPGAQAAAPAPTTGGVDKETLFWQSIQASDDPTMFEAYLEQYPTGAFAPLARAKVRALQGRQTAALTAPPSAFEVTPLDEELVAAKNTNVRAEPATDARKLTTLRAGANVAVTGRTTHQGATWYRVALAGVGVGYVFGNLLREAPTVAPAPVRPAVGVYPGRYEPGDTFRDCADCPEMVVVPAGSFRMGDLNGGGADDEKPVHTVTIGEAFAVGKYEVTFAEWDACVAAGGCNGRRSVDAGWGRSRRPVINVSWDDAKRYVSWLSSRTGRRYRLLSEAEWEYAARAGTTTKWSCGSSEGCLNAVAWYSANSGNRTFPVGAKVANAFGLYDMHGNVVGVGRGLLDRFLRRGTERGMGMDERRLFGPCSARRFLAHRTGEGAFRKPEQDHHRRSGLQHRVPHCADPELDVVGKEEAHSTSRRDRRRLEMTWRLARALGMVLALAMVLGGEALAGTRVALVIGNDAYATLPDLNNATADARGMAAKLKSLGFDVILKLNARKRDIGRALADFEGRLASAEVGLVFYAGHGIQADGRNYLIPSNAEIDIEEDLRFEGVDSSEILQTMKRAGSPLNIVILDACRDNPLPRRSRSAARGLAIAQVPRGIKGTAIVYSAAPGETAQDGDPGGNGVFTGALLAVLDEPGLKLEDVFKKTAARVARRTGGKQQPWINSSVTGDFYFREGPGATVSPAPATAPAASGSAAEVAFWQSIQGSTEAADFEDYLAQFPNGTFARLAKRRVEALKGQKVAALTSTFEVEDMDTEMEAAKLANVRAQPTTQAPKIGSLGEGERVTVTGRAEVRGKTWWRVALANGDTGFVWGPLLEEPKTVVESAPPAPLGQTAPPGGTGTDATVWAGIKDSNRASDFETFVKTFPESPFAPFARARLEELRGRQATIVPPAIERLRGVNIWVQTDVTPRP